MVTLLTTSPLLWAVIRPPAVLFSVPPEMATPERFTAPPDARITPFVLLIAEVLEKGYRHRLLPACRHL
jgi:hypothetical protein